MCGSISAMRPDAAQPAAQNQGNYWLDMIGDMVSLTMECDVVSTILEVFSTLMF